MLPEPDEIFKRVCVCRLFRLSGLQEILQNTGLPVEPVSLIWQVGDLSARDYVMLDSSISNYIVNREKAELVIPMLESPLFCELHKAWREWYQSEYKKNFRVDALAAVLYHKGIYFRECTDTEGDVLNHLQSEVQEYLWEYCHFVAGGFGFSTISSLSLKRVFVVLINKYKCKEVADYVPSLSQKIRELDIFHGILSSSENETFLKFLDFLNRLDEEV